MNARWVKRGGLTPCVLLILCSYNIQMKITLPSDISQLLGGYSPQRFLQHYWHRKPLLIRNAIPGFKPVLAKSELFALAASDDVESRLVARVGRSWQLEHGPFSARTLRAARLDPWTLLVQGVNLHHDAADRLFHRFDFIPMQRLDDLMVSYASDGGGVGPHFDSYDVFLLQAAGRRRWRISMQEDRGLVRGAPLKILSRFRPEAEYVLEPGDMLYLPPGCAHDGVALGECMTYSIGFRAPSAGELRRGLFEHLADGAHGERMYEDPGLKPTSTPGMLDEQYLARAARLIGRIQPTRDEVACFLGCHLTEPKANVYFDLPRQTLPRAAFVRQAYAHGVALDRRTRMLYRGKQCFINGESVPNGADTAVIKDLADQRRLAPATQIPRTALDLLYSWYTHGWITAARAS